MIRQGNQDEFPKSRKTMRAEVTDESPHFPLLTA